MTRDGLTIAEISQEEFRDFAKRYATSPEIGPIQTSLDGGVDKKIDFDRVLVGLAGCGTLCAVACLHLHQSVLEKGQQALKLDSVIVDDRLRRRGLAGLLVTQSFVDQILRHGRGVASIYAYAVHPGSLRLLRRLGFNDPHAIGAPLSNINFETDDREAFLKECNNQITSQMIQMKRQCAWCRKGNRRADPWCLPRGEKPKHRFAAGGGEI
ncbi:MAG: hypothetical protein O7G83_20700 [Proteobacteria bacterium]|nr:hypothetical protein [Pseudomonadota bacterium]